MKVIHFLSSVDLTKRTGVFHYRTDKCTQWIKVDVSISALLAWRIANKSTNKRERLPVNIPYTGHAFVSLLTSPNYEDSPFRVVYFEPHKGSDIPANFKLECVDEYGESIKDVVLNKIVGYKDGIRRSTQYMRYEQRKVSKSMAEITASIIAPNLVRVPI